MEKKKAESIRNENKSTLPSGHCLPHAQRPVLYSTSQFERWVPRAGRWLEQWKSSCIFCLSLFQFYFWNFFQGSKNFFHNFPALIFNLGSILLWYTLPIRNQGNNPKISQTWFDTLHKVNLDINCWRSRVRKGRGSVFRWKEMVTEWYVTEK